MVGLVAADRRKGCACLGVQPDQPSGLAEIQLGATCRANLLDKSVNPLVDDESAM
jgi:hypothetical protein